MFLLHRSVYLIFFVYLSSGTTTILFFSFSLFHTLSASLLTGPVTFFWNTGTYPLGRFHFVITLFRLLFANTNNTTVTVCDAASCHVYKITHICLYAKLFLANACSDYGSLLCRN